MNGSGMGSVAPGQAKVANPAVSSQAQQRGKEKSVLLQAPSGSARRAEREVVIPEWKLRSLCTEYGLPPTVRGSLHTSGCF